MGAQWLDFDNFLRPLGHSIFTQFRDPPNLLNCNKHDVKTLILQFQAHYFGIEDQLQIHVFSRHAPGPIFYSFYLNLYQKVRFVDPLQNPVGC